MEQITVINARGLMPLILKRRSPINAESPIKRWGSEARVLMGAFIRSFMVCILHNVLNG